MSQPKFICDAMLGHIGRRLRSAGYDTLIDAGKISDNELLKLAIADNRILLTSDKGFRDSTRAIFSPLSDEKLWARLLPRAAGVDWTFAPMTRCLDCNTTLTPADATHAELMPEGIRKYSPSGVVCLTCNKVFWEGSHTRRMRARLEDLKRESLNL